MLNVKLFFQKRSIWLPTPLTAILMLLLTLMFFYYVATYVAVFLSKTEMVNAKILVVEGWIPKTGLNEAYRVFIDGEYQLLITTGGPVIDGVDSKFTDYAEQAATYFRKIGVSKEKVIAISTPASAQNRTFLSAVMLRKAIQSKRLPGFYAMNIISQNVHARRTHFLYNEAFRNTPIIIGIKPVLEHEFNMQQWWKSSAGAKKVITELIGLVYAMFLFEVPEINSHQEMWAVVK